MKPPCVIVVQYILPALRVAITRELVEVYGFKKSRVAGLMGLTPAAITQYINMSRGDNLKIIENSGRVKELVSELACDMVKGACPPDMLLLQMCRICQVVRSEGHICDLHMEVMPQLRDVRSCACGLGLVPSLK